MTTRSEARRLAAQAPIGAPRERPIIFSGAEVRAILAGHLTQTRRPVKHDFMHRPDGARAAKWYIRARRDGVWDSYETLAELVARHSPYGVPGDRLWVRETWAVRYQLDDLPAGEVRRHAPGLWLRADHPERPYRPGRGKWRPSVHMPRWAARLTLDVLSVHVERDRNEWVWVIGFRRSEASDAR